MDEQKLRSEMVSFFSLIEENLDMAIIEAEPDELRGENVEERLISRAVAMADLEYGYACKAAKFSFDD